MASAISPRPSQTDPLTLTLPNHMSSLNLDPAIDPLDALLNLEETFYQQGYTLGHADGALQGLVEGRVFGTERGFDKFFAMARLHGHAIVLGNRLPRTAGVVAETAQAPASEADSDPDLDGWDPGTGTVVRLDVLSATARLEKHVRTLYALTEPASLALMNDEDEVSEFDDRFKRAQAKAVIVGRMVGFELEGSDAGAKGKGKGAGGGAEREMGAKQSAEASIEDASILQARH